MNAFYFQIYSGFIGLKSIEGQGVTIMFRIIKTANISKITTVYVKLFIIHIIKGL